MGEAWFLSAERAVYNELGGGALTTVPVADLMPFLFDIASGICNFGRSAEWVDWLHYALPDLIERSAERNVNFLLEPTVTAFMAAHWNGVIAPYDGFEADILASLHHCMMAQDRWREGREGSEGLLELDDPRKMTSWDSRRDDLSCALFFAIRYLPVAHFADFVQSVVSIPCLRWRAHLLTWLATAAEILANEQPTIAHLEQLWPRLEWENAHVLPPRFEPGEFIPTDRRTAFLAALRRALPEDRVLSWMDDMWASGEIAAEFRRTSALDLLADRYFE